MASKLTSPMSNSPAYQLWTMSVLMMLLPPLIGLAIGDSSQFDYPSERLIYFCGFFVLLIDELGVFNNLRGLIGYPGSNTVAGVLFIGIVVMWFMILALPAFNRFSLKKRYRLHFLQFVYSTIQVVAGAIYARGSL